MPHLRSALRAYALAVLLAVCSGLVAVLVAGEFRVPLRDPDGFLGPAWVRLPVIALLFVALDVIPRALRRRRPVREVLRERYGPARAALVVVGLGTFYLTYLSYRNLKGALPFARPDVHDLALLQLDRAMAMGYDPSHLLHTWLGTGVAAYVLSAVYLVFLGFVPFSVVGALIWLRDVRAASWYVTALCLNWILGTVSYYLVPSLGPVFVRPNRYADLPETGVTVLQRALAETRLEVLINPTSAEGIAGVAGFASLHVSVVFTAALVAHRIGLPRALCRVLWVFLGLTMTATIYFGWHYLVDDLAGLALGWSAVTLAGWASRAVTRELEHQHLLEESRPAIGSGAAAG
jgi:membrane-associated phospholipid phosphatase